MENSILSRFFPMNRKSDREEMASVVQQWMCEPFHIYDEHLFEFRILCLRDENVVYGKFHHLIADSYAISLVVKIIEKIYEDLEKGIETFKTDRRFLEKVERMDTACKENRKFSRIKGHRYRTPGFWQAGLRKKNRIILQKS